MPVAGYCLCQLRFPNNLSNAIDIILLNMTFNMRAFMLIARGS
jgi:hypothetical protein